MSGFGSEPGESGFNKFTKEYKASPTIENYVRLRREFPNQEIEIATTGGIEFLFAYETELRSVGIEPREVTGVLDADPEAHAALSLKLLGLLIDRREEQKTGGTHLVSRKKVVSDTLVNYLIGAALDSLSWNDELEISRELIVLIKHQLGCVSSHYETGEEKREKRRAALLIGAQIAANGETPTYRRIGQALGVQASTVMRWFPDNSFISEMKTLGEACRQIQLEVAEFKAKMVKPNPPARLEQPTLEALHDPDG
jgi:hypothetical protein